MATVVLPQSLTVLFPALARRAEVQAATVLECIEGLNDRWPGMRSRLLDAGPRLREHIQVFVDAEQAGLDTPVGPDAEVRSPAGGNPSGRRRGRPGCARRRPPGAQPPARVTL